MGLGTNHNTVTTAANFIPEIWSDEVIAAYKANIVMPERVTRLNHKGKKGDTIHVPNFTRGSANAKTASNQVTLNTATHSVTNISLDKHYEYSVLIEDIVEKQALSSLRKMYIDDAGYALAKQTDTDLINLGSGLQGGSSYSGAVIGSDGSTAWSASANTNTGNGATLTDAGIRRVLQTLDDNDVPMNDRTLLVPPIEKKNLLGLARYTEQAFVGNGNAIRTGQIGEIYGVPVFVSTNCATVTAADTSTDYRACLLFHREAFCHAEQQGVRTQSQYKQEYLADLFTADCIYGVAEMRDTAGVAIIVPST